MNTRALAFVVVGVVVQEIVIVRDCAQRRRKRRRRTKLKKKTKQVTMMRWSENDHNHTNDDEVVVVMSENDVGVKMHEEKEEVEEGMTTRTPTRKDALRRRRDTRNANTTFMTNVNERDALQQQQQEEEEEERQKQNLRPRREKKDSLRKFPEIQKSQHQQKQQKQQQHATEPRPRHNTTKTSRGGGEKRLGPCDHCGVRESPQWRKGPPKKPMLCNACGTRYMRTRSLSGGNAARARQDSSGSTGLQAGAAVHAASTQTRKRKQQPVKRQRQRQRQRPQQMMMMASDDDDDAAGFMSGTDEMESRRRRGSAGAADSLVGPSATAKRVRATSVFGEAAAAASEGEDKGYSSKKKKRRVSFSSSSSSVYTNALLMAVALAIERDGHRLHTTTDKDDNDVRTSHLPAAVVPVTTTTTTTTTTPLVVNNAAPSHAVTTPTKTCAAEAPMRIIVDDDDDDEAKDAGDDTDAPAMGVDGSSALALRPPSNGRHEYASVVGVGVGVADTTTNASPHSALNADIINASNLRAERFRSRKISSGRYIGVTCAVNRRGRTWQARIRGPGADGRERAYVHLGMHSSPEAAARAFDRAAIVVHGLHRAVLNFNICDYADELDKLMLMTLPELAAEYRCRPHVAGGNSVADAAATAAAAATVKTEQNLQQEDEEDSLPQEYEHQCNAEKEEMEEEEEATAVEAMPEMGEPPASALVPDTPKAAEPSQTMQTGLGVRGGGGVQVIGGGAFALPNAYASQQPSMLVHPFQHWMLLNAAMAGRAQARMWR